LWWRQDRSENPLESAWVAAISAQGPTTPVVLRCRMARSSSTLAKESWPSVVVTLTAASHASNACGIGGGVLPSLTYCTAPVFASLASGSAICEATRGKTRVSTATQIPRRQRSITPLTVFFWCPFKCARVHDTLVSCRCVSTCAATVLCLVDSLRRASYPLRKLSSGTDGFLIAGRRTRLTVTHPLHSWTPLRQARMMKSL
jgi:hypothetical protein